VGISLPLHRCVHARRCSGLKIVFRLGSGRNNISEELFLADCAALLIESAAMSISKTIWSIVKIALFVEETMLSIGKAMLLIE
jgi:hypothetical protein